MNSLLIEISTTLDGAGISQASREADRIVQAAKVAAPADHEDVARAMAQRRVAGVPLAYVIGHETFMGVDLVVGEGALAPREETELLGYTALEAIRASGADSPKIIDMCCGSGNLACAIAHHFPTAKVWASDLTDGCVSVARRNVMHVGVSDRVVVAQGDLFAGLADFGLEGAVDVVVCNPPYISQGKLATDRAVLLEHEPREAFDGGPYGLSIQQRVVKEALPFLRPGGTLLFEIGLGQERQVKMLFDRVKEYEDIRLIANAAGEVRVVSGRKRGN
ncbi:MAG: HemK family protein methyltransferase [Gammaproteobacteria bacterium]|nr:HemK family protein methyltransferase [Gammaproteobacteria bacterium]MBU1776495.1 HemK family protein methyltransferase [Gammaproteobacteria bacterium]MBU1969752.1 HemK family protein methyltransferase [Gammaproteobacteria bacterium]